MMRAGWIAVERKGVNDGETTLVVWVTDGGGEKQEEAELSVAAVPI